MHRIILKDITKVYRFGIQAESWERDRAESFHFLAYKLHGFTLHEQNGNLLPFGKDMLMVASSEDRYRVLRHEMAAEGVKGGCIAVHFTTVNSFDLHLSTYDCSNQPKIRSLFFRMLSAWQQAQTSGAQSAMYECISCFYTILSQLFFLSEQPSVSPTDKLEQARVFIDRNYCYNTLSIADVAAAIGLGQRRFGELFLTRYHQTPAKYLTACRIAAAVKLLTQDQLSVSEIASLTGYTSSSYFIRVFRQETGISPKAYRLQSEK